eukprot:scaffold31514_cov114-Isochrysis_galbana.AAC.7
MGGAVGPTCCPLPPCAFPRPGCRVATSAAALRLRPKRRRPGSSRLGPPQPVVCQPPAVEPAARGQSPDGSRHGPVLIVEDKQVAAAVGQRLQILGHTSRKQLANELRLTAVPGVVPERLGHVLQERRVKDEASHVHAEGARPVARPQPAFGVAPAGLETVEPPLVVVRGPLDQVLPCGEVGVRQRRQDTVAWRRRVDGAPYGEDAHAHRPQPADLIP